MPILHVTASAQQSQEVNPGLSHSEAQALTHSAGSARPFCFLSLHLGVALGLVPSTSGPQVQGPRDAWAWARTRDTGPERVLVTFTPKYHSFHATRRRAGLGAGHHPWPQGRHMASSFSFPRSQTKCHLLNELPGYPPVSSRPPSYSVALPAISFVVLTSTYDFSVPTVTL